MKASRFALERPRDLEEAGALLADAGGFAKVLAGGQSLGPMLNLRLVEPDLVVDVSGVAELRRFDREGETLVIGACCTHADIEDGRVPDVGADMLARVASGIAYRAVRNRGTIGGSLSHADPAADWLSALSALGATVEVASRTGRHRLAIGDFVTGALETALQADEVLAAVRIPMVPETARFGFLKHARKVGEFAHAIGAALIDPEHGTGRCVIGAIDAPPLVFPDASILFDGRIRRGFASEFDRSVADRALIEAGVVDPVARHVHVEILRRAVVQAAGEPIVETRAAA
jgi:carbon-monoxide dehydrogenase medium subunit